jgi:alpha-mannosidase
MGTLSVRVPDKQLYARATRTLERLAEPLAALWSSDVSAQLQNAWTMVLQNAAHDTACGSGIDAVAEAARHRSERALSSCQAVVDRCLPFIAATGELWNPSPFPRQAVIEADGGPVLTAPIPGYSSAKLRTLDPVKPVEASGNRLENGQLKVTLLADGTIDVLHKATGVSYRGLARVEDEADAGDEYNFSPPPEADQSPVTVSVFRPWQIVERAPVRTRARMELRCLVPAGLAADRRRRSGEQVALPISLTIAMEADSARLDFECELENKAKDHRLRLHFPLPFSPKDSAADTAFHVTRRPVVGPRRDPGSPEVELPTYPMRSFVDVSDGHAGLALITDGLHEYEVLPAPSNELALTLLRAVGWLSRDDLATRTGHAGPELETPGAQVLGVHHFRFSVYFHSGDWQTGNTWRAAESALLPLQPGTGERRRGATQVIEFEPACVQLTACSPTAGGFDLRILNAGDEATSAVLRLRPKPSAVTRLTLGGEPLQGPEQIGDQFRVRLRPWEIATLRIER